jgi:arylsulfatase A-like enzyme
VRLIYFDVDTLRADHLGCYGYERDTSPNIDRLAAEGVRFDQVYASDTPCLPSRTALITGRFGVPTGVNNHGGVAADLFLEGSRRGVQTQLARTAWPRVMRQAGIRSTTVSTFGERHSAYHWYAGFNEVHNLGLAGSETADQVTGVALNWLDRCGRDDGWFLHLHFWDPHTPYRTPASFGDPFAGTPALTWIDEPTRQRHWHLPGPHSAQEVTGFDSGPAGWPHPRQPLQIDSLEAVGHMADGYDTGIRYADAHIGMIIERLESLGVWEETAVLLSSDHGENLGELGIYGDHQTADLPTTRLPFILRWPGVPGGWVDTSLRYQIDGAATILELLGVHVPSDWDGRSFAPALREGARAGTSPRDGVGERDYLVLTQAAWCVQRSVRFDRWLCVRTYNDAFHGFDDVMLFDVVDDPHEQRELAGKHADVVSHAMSLLTAWQAEAMRTSRTGIDPIATVLHEGGGWYARRHRDRYLARLRRTGREEWADRFAARGHPAGG